MWTKDFSKDKAKRKSKFDSNQLHTHKHVWCKTLKVHLYSMSESWGMIHAAFLHFSG